MNVYEYIEKIKCYVDSMSAKEIMSFHKELTKRQNLDKNTLVNWLVNYMDEHGVSRGKIMNSPLNALKMRLANGEINIEEYKKIKEELEK